MKSELIRVDLGVTARAFSARDRAYHFWSKMVETPFFFQRARAHQRVGRALARLYRRESELSAVLRSEEESFRSSAR